MSNNDIENGVKGPDQHPDNAEQVPIDDLDMLEVIAPPVQMNSLQPQKEYVVVNETTNSNYRCGCGVVVILLLVGIMWMVSAVIIPGMDIDPNNQSSATGVPTGVLSDWPSAVPAFGYPSLAPSEILSDNPSWIPSNIPSRIPSALPSRFPSAPPSRFPSAPPSGFPSSGPSGAPSAAPSPSPSATPSGSPSANPSWRPSMTPTVAELCGMPLSEVLGVAQEAGEGFGNVGASLEEYITEYSPNGLRELKGSDIRKMKKFETSAIKRITKFIGKGLKLFSPVADVLTMFGFLLPDEGYDDRFDQMEDLLKAGFDELKAAVVESSEGQTYIFAMEDIGDAFEDVHNLEVKRDNYMHPGHSPSSRGAYRVPFFKACISTNHSPYVLMVKMYKHACKTCEKLAGRSNFGLRERVIKMAWKLFPDNLDGRIWYYRTNYGGPLLKYVVIVLSLHFQCLYSEEQMCHEDDPVWPQTRDELIAAGVEIAEFIGDGEIYLYETPAPSEVPSPAPVEMPTNLLTPCAYGRRNHCRGTKPLKKKKNPCPLGRC